MPIYEYACPQCGHRFEKLRKMSEAGQPLACPQCGAAARQEAPTGVDTHASRKRPF